MTVNTDKKAIQRVLELGVTDVIVRKDLEKKLASGKKLRVKLGIDPTGFDLHLGHMVVVHKLKELQDLGHQIILLFGNFTGQIGDPTGKNETRQMRTQAELEENAKHYVDQVSKILNVDKVEVRWNAEWLAPLSFADVVQLSSHFTVAQMLERDMFQDRIKNGQAISMHEFMYPLMQGYDSVALEADLELGGTDQTFNLLAGRTLQKAYGQTPQDILTVPLLIGTDGSMKMGKSTNNYIAVDDSPEDMLGKTMSIPDELILHYFELAARVDLNELSELKDRLKNENPRNLKMELAKRIVALYHDDSAAAAAEEHFVNLFKKKEIPDDIEEVALSPADWGLIDLIVELDMATSKSEARRLIQGGGVKLDLEKCDDIEKEVTLTSDKLLIQVGKRKFKRAYLK